MKAVGQERRSAAQPPKHPSGQKVAGDGTWGEGTSAFTGFAPISAGTAPDKKGSPVPTIAIAGAPGEAPMSLAPASIPDKRGGPTPAPVLGGPGAEGAAQGGAPAPDDSRDPCAKASEIHPDGSQQPKEGAKAEAPRSSGLEIACHTGKVHSAAAGRDEKRTVPSAAAPDGAFAVHTGEPAKSPPQGPAGGFADAPGKSAGYGTARIDVGSCAPQDPSMTVRMPPSHPALGAAPRRRPTPSVPAFGARAALTARTQGEVGTRAPRGLSVSQVHLSGPMLHAAPRIPRTDALAEAPSGSLADDAAPAGHRQAAAPGGTAGAGQAKGAEAEGLFTPTAAQAAASARGGGGGGGLTTAQQHATNAIRMDETKGEIGKLDSALPGLKKDAEEASKRLSHVEPAVGAQYQANAALEVARQEAADAKTQWKKDKDAYSKGEISATQWEAAQDNRKAKDDRLEDAEAEAQKANVDPETIKEYKAAKKDADEKQRKVDENQEQWNDLESERQTLDAKNDKLEEGMSPTEKARADKDKKRLKRDQDRQREIQDRLEEKRLKREERNSKRPDYRATQRAKARRADNKRSKSLAKAKKLLGIATSKNKNLSAKARKSALAKAKKQIQKAKQAALDKLDALDKAKASDAEIKEAEQELKEAEELENDIEEAEGELEEEPPPPDPCSLPCDCNIPCDDICVCSRSVSGGEPVPNGGGGGGAAEPTPPDVLTPEGTTVADEGNGNGQGGDDDGKKPSGNGNDGGRGGHLLVLQPPQVGPVGAPFVASEGSFATILLLVLAALTEDERAKLLASIAAKAKKWAEMTDDDPNKPKNFDCADVAWTALAESAIEIKHRIRIKVGDTLFDSADKKYRKADGTVDVEKFTKDLRTNLGSINIFDRQIFTTKIEPARTETRDDAKAKLQPGDMIMYDLRSHKDQRYKGHTMIVVSNDPANNKVTVVEGHLDRPIGKTTYTHEELDKKFRAGADRRGDYIQGDLRRWKIGSDEPKSPGGISVD